LDLISKSEEGDKLREEAQRVSELAELKDREQEIKDQLETVDKWVSTLPLMSDYEVAMSVSKRYNMNITEAKSQLDSFPKQYTIENKSIPEVVKDLKKHRRKLKGDNKLEFTKGIENLIVAYSNHLSDCIKSIYWLAPYETPLRQMRYTENDLKKIHSIKDEGTITDIPNQVIKTNVSKQLDDFVLKSVCNEQGISARQIYDRLPTKLHRRASPQIICKIADKMNITNIDGEYYKLPMEIKKDLYAYTAAFIDSDGYITMDRNYNPRIGIIATGNRGKAFVTELHKELGFGKLHLDQKSPQATRAVQRLNFYSQDDITKLISKTRPHYRMKGDNADILTELIRIKKNHKKQSWAKERMQELFKLMKWANHADHVNYDFSKDGIDVENIAKYKENNKMSVMDELENIVKSDLDDAIDELEGIVESYQLSDDEWDSLDDASDYLFEHQGPQGSEEE